MKTTKLFISLLLILFAVPSLAQDTYRQTLEQYVKTNPKLRDFASDKMKLALTMINPNILTGKSLEEGNELADRYLKEQLFNDLMDNMMPIMQKHITENELKEMNAILATPEGLDFTTNNMKWEEKMEKELLEVLTKGIGEINEGQTPAPLEVSKGISKSYQDKFTKYLEASKQMEGFKKGLELGGQNQLSQEVLDWVMKIAPTLFVNTAHGLLTEQNLDFATKLSDRQSYAHTMDAVNEIVSNPMVMGMQIITSYISWLKKQGASVVDLGL